MEQVTIPNFWQAVYVSCRFIDRWNIRILNDEEYRYIYSCVIAAPNVSD